MKNMNKGSIVMKLGYVHKILYKHIPVTETVCYMHMYNIYIYTVKSEQS